MESFEERVAWNGKQPKDPNPVIIIGAGLSGLTAAYQLKQAGISVRIFEAANQPGGRTQTVWFPNGSLEELGGKEISDGGDAPCLRAMADTLGVCLQSQLRPYGVVTLDNQARLKDFFQIASPIPEKLFQFKEPFCFLSEHLDEVLGARTHRRRLFETWIACYEGTNTQNLSYAQSIPILKRLQNRVKLGTQRPEPGLRPCVYFEKGSTSFVEKLQTALKDVLVCNQMLTSLEWVEGRLRLNFQNGHQVWASTVVLTLPIEILKRLPMEGLGFPEGTFSAIRGGSNTKILIPVPHAHPDNKGFFSMMPEFDSWWNADLRVLTVYKGGRHAEIPLETFEQQEAIFNKLWPTLCKLYPFLKGESVTFEDCVFKNWAAHPYSRCSYSYVHEDWAEATVSYQGEKVLACFRPLREQLFFAGEHTSVTFPGTMEGAVESGDRIARMIMKQRRSCS